MMRTEIILRSITKQRKTEGVRLAERMAVILLRSRCRQTARRLASEQTTSKAKLVLVRPEIINDLAYGPIVLDPEGMEFRPHRKRIPLCDTIEQSDQSVSNVFGSIIRVVNEAGVLVGLAEFATDTDAQKIATRLREGAIISEADLRVRIIEGIDVREGETYYGFSGPFIFATKWQPLSAHLKC